MKKRTEIKGLYWDYYKSLVLRKAFLGRFVYLIAFLFLMLIIIFSSANDVKYEPARIISAGLSESRYGTKSRYKVETFSGETYFVVENVNRGSRNIDQMVCLQIRTLRIIGSQIANLTLNSRCPEISQ